MSVYDPEALIFKNQIVISETSDAINASSGSFVISGGIAVAKSVVVSGDQSIGGQMTINNINVTPNLNDIIFEQQASLAPNTTSFTDISGFTFNNSTVSAFKAYITVVVTGPLNLYALWELMGVYTNTGWTYSSSYTGSPTNVNFFVANISGKAQIQYTNLNSNSYSTIIRYRATTTAPPGTNPVGGQGLYSSTSNNYITNTLLYANTSDTVASAGDITYVSNELNIGGASTLNVNNAADANNFTSASIVIAGGASIAKKLLVGTQLGIATSAPGYTLDINGDINIGGTIYQNGSIYSGSSLWEASGSNYYINPTSANVGIGTTNPAYSLDVNGTINTTELISNNITTNNLYSINVSSGSILTTNNFTTNSTVNNLLSTNITVGNSIKTGAGTLGPFILLQTHYIDVTTGNYSGYTSSNTIIFNEPGNPGSNGAIGYTNGFGSGNLSDGSNDNIIWNRARLVIRGVSLNTANTPASVVIEPIAIQATSGNVYTQTSFTANDNGTNRGYSTWITDWFTTNIVSDSQALGIKVLSLNGTTGNVRIGPVYMQFST
jgi:hypothetical protein